MQEEREIIIIKSNHNKRDIYNFSLRNDNKKKRDWAWAGRSAILHYVLCEFNKFYYFVSVFLQYLWKS